MRACTHDAQSRQPQRKAAALTFCAAPRVVGRKRAVVQQDGVVWLLLPVRRICCAIVVGVGRAQLPRYQQALVYAQGLVHAPAAGPVTHTRGVVLVHDALDVQVPAWSSHGMNTPCLAA